MELMKLMMGKSDTCESDGDDDDESERDVENKVELAKRRKETNRQPRSQVTECTLRKSPHHDNNSWSKTLSISCKYRSTSAMFSNPSLKQYLNRN